MSLLQRSMTALLIAVVLASLVPAVASATTSDCTPTRRGFRCVYGPVTVGPGANQINATVASPTVPGYITVARAGLVDESGDPVPGHAVHIHHAGWWRSDRSQPICGGRRDLVYITGKERTRMEYPNGYGYYWPGTESGFALHAMLDNMHDMEMTVYLRLNLHYTAADEGSLASVRNNWLTATGCGSHDEFDVVKGDGKNGRVRRAATYEMPVSGRFVWGTGHMHDGGIKMIFKNVTRGVRIFTSKALYEDRHDPWYLTGTTTYSAAPGIRANAGDRLRVIVVYDSTRTWRDVMGNLRASFVPIDQ